MEQHGLPDFLIIPGIIIRDKTLQPLDGQVYGLIYWYTKLKLEKCIASNQKMSDLLGVHPNSISRSLGRLAIRKYITIISDEFKHRLEIVPNLTLSPNIDPNPNPVGLPPLTKWLTPLNQMVNPPKPNGLHNKNNLIRKVNKNIIPASQELNTFKRKKEENQTQLQKICYYLEDALNTQIVNWGKQAKALSMMLKAGYTEKQILFAVKYMANDDFYEDKGFDLMTVANNIAQIKAKVRREVKPFVRTETN